MLRLMIYEETQLVDISWVRLVHLLCVSYSLCSSLYVSLRIPLRRLDVLYLCMSCKEYKQLDSF
jgi:hypothetical protein